MGGQPERRTRAMTAGVAVGVGALLAAFTATSAACTDTATAPEPTARARSAHGSLVSSHAFDGAETLQRATNTMLRYRQVAIGGGLTESTAVLSVPDGTPPAGGWPLIVQAHGTTGIADRCAPSAEPRDPQDSGDRSWDVMQGYLDAGYAVVRPDYEGLGTPGLHPYLIGRSAGRALLDAARAARAADPDVSPRTVLDGFSQGGHAVLWAAGMAARYTPDVDLLGTVALAPVSDYSERLGRRSWNPDGGPGPGELVLVAIGASTVDTSIRPRRLLTRQAREHYGDALHACLDRIDSPDGLGGVQIEDVFRAKADLGPAVAVAERSEPNGLRITTPLLIAQGEDDDTVAPNATAALVEDLRALGADVDYRTYPGGHGEVTTASADDVRAFITAVAGG